MDSSTVEKEALLNLLKRVQGTPPPSQGAGAAAKFPEAASMEELPESDPRRARADLFRSVHLKVRVELGRVQVPLKEILKLTPGAVVDLDRLADDPVDVYVDDLLIARGEVIVVNDCFCVRLTEVFSQSEPGEVRS